MNNEIIFKTKSFRKIPNPYYLSDEEALKGAEMYYIVCDVKDVPADIPMDTNPREQKLTTAVAKKIRTSLTTPGANNFYLLNRGLLLSAEKVTFNSKNETVSVVFSDTSVHGDIDGGHTYKIIQECQSELDYGQQYVKIEILTGVEDMFQELASARNTSTQVQDKSIAELYNRFDIIKRAIQNESFKDEVFFEENAEGSIDVSDILALLNLYNIDRYPDLNDYAIVSYNGKKQCIDYYIKQHMEKGETLENPYIKMSKIMVDIFKLYDQLELKARDYYSGGVSGKKYALVVGVNKRKDGKPAYKTKYYKNNTDYITPNGFLFPILGAFRALIDVDSEGYYCWKKDPFRVLDKVGSDLMETTVDTSRTLGNNPNATGKNKTLWKNLYMCVAMETMHKD